MGTHAKPKDSAPIRHEGPTGYATVPNWVNDRFPKDVWLYAHLRGYYGGLEAMFPGIQRIADHFGMSAPTVKRALRVLVTGGAITREARFRTNGGQTSNGYVTHWAPPEDR